MITGQNIVCFANDWDADPTSKHQVMTILARTNRVLWVNSIGLRRPGATVADASRVITKIRQYLAGATPINSNMHAVTPLVIPFHHLRWVRRVNAWLVSRYVRAQARRLGMDKFEVWVILPSAASIVRQLKPERVIYYCVDDWSAFSFLDGEAMQDMEAQLIAQSDIVFVSAEALYKTKRPLNPRTYLVPHGVDSEHFARARLPETEVAPELTNLPRPIVGFWGSVHEWIDLDLLRYMAKRHPEWSIVLVGRVAVERDGCGFRVQPVQWVIVSGDVMLRRVMTRAEDDVLPVRRPGRVGLIAEPIQQHGRVRAGRIRAPQVAVACDVRYVNDPRSVRRRCGPLRFGASDVGLGARQRRDQQYPDECTDRRVSTPTLTHRNPGWHRRLPSPQENGMRGRSVCPRR